ncbi:MAG: 1,2-phenylacetyl-CoA epoxidase subunit PaaC [Cyclobacteriaceae bacterium]
MLSKEVHFDYLIRQADNCLILGQRLGEWCGHGPVLEQDIAMTNISLDLIGQSRSLYQYAAKIQGDGKSEDDLAYLRDVLQFRNFLLVEQPNEDFGYTVARQFFFDVFNYHFYKELAANSNDEQLVNIAVKSLKEVSYHVKWSSEWIIRLGDGTDESHERIQAAVNDRWPYTGEMFIPNQTDEEALKLGIGIDLVKIKPLWDKMVSDTLAEATLEKPEASWMHQGGKDGRHTEHLGYILADLQFLQRAYPGASW